jgi:light-regulated signal transduction histidine kinase (bacteriophytochrome)
MVCNRYLVADEPVIQCNVRDVTERKRAEDELRRSNEDLQQFAYAASHDLQEPLRMVGAYSQLLNKKFQPLVDQEGAKFLEVIATSVHRMEQLIKDLLIYSQTSVYEARSTPVNAEQVLGLAVMNLQLAIADTGAIITNDALPTVIMDQIHFVQVFQNLIANALKFRKPGEAPRVHVSAQRQKSDWVFSVTDQGLGFDDQYADQIFGVFRRLHGKDYPGTGIGLSICKKIIERAGGRIWAKSSVGVGSTFFFSIPDNLTKNK